MGMKYLGTLCPQAWFLVCGIVLGALDCTILLKEVCHWDWALRLDSLFLLLVCFLRFIRVEMEALSFLPFIMLATAV